MKSIRISLGLLLAVLCVHCGGSAPRSPSERGAQNDGCSDASGATDCADSTPPESNTNWHPDPDGDGVPRGVDHCPQIYDPDQSDADGDGVGDFCDPDFTTASKSGRVVDLRAEHVTPYGGWFAFTSPRTTPYGQDYMIAWSDTPSDLLSGKSIGALPANRRKIFRVFDAAGMRLFRPQTITSMSPKKKYYIAVTPLNDYDKPTNAISNISTIETAEAPTLEVEGPGPRVWLTPSELKMLQNRATKGDRSWKKWAKIMGGSVQEAARSKSRFDFEECLSAALLFHGSGAKKYRTAALTIIESMRAYWQSNSLENNLLRWADANLGICAGMMWEQLSESQHNAIVSAYLEDDEAASIERMVDTDEYASITRTWIIDGLVGCRAPKLKASLSKRACALLDRGKRAFYGVQLVKARRDQGFFAQSGGNLPDGNGYGVGTSKYWLQTLYALGNVGGDVDSYAPWVWHNLQAMQIQALTPKKRGFASFGDLDSYDNFSVEANSLPVPPHNGGLIAMHMGLLDRAGKIEQARHARWHLDNLYPDDDFGGTWAMLLFSNDDLKAARDADGMPTTFWDKSMGMFYDRTSWSHDASFLTFRSGWSGADHAHEDAGAFQLYRKGTWLTNEDLGYDGPASEAQGHNVPALEIGFESEGSRVGQFNLESAAAARTLRAVGQRDYTYISADLLGAYSSSRYHSFRYQSVDRQLFWIKPSKNNTEDRLLVYDRIVSSKDAPRGHRDWQLHINAKPTVQGAHASFQSGSYVETELLLPSSVALRYEPPQGKHSQYPGERYTGRLLGEAKGQGQEVQFLAALQASDNKKGMAARAVESDNFVGALWDDTLVVFAKRRDRATDAAISLTVPHTGPLRIRWTGLSPNAPYALATERSGSDVNVIVTPGGTTTSDAAGVVTFNVP